MNVHLQRLRQQPMAPGIPRQQLLAELEAALENPQEIDQGLHPHMCVPAVLESYLAQVHPDDFVHLVAGLAAPEGRATTRSGQVIFRVEDALEDDGTDRSLLDRLVQSALYAAAERAVGSQRSYSSLHHTLEDQPARGLGPWQTQHLLQQITGDDSWQKTRPSLATLQSALQHGPIPLVLNTGGGNGHQLLLESIEGAQARLRDPEGAYASPFKGAHLEAGVQTMSTEALAEQMGQAYLKATWLPAEDRDPSSWILG